MCHRLERHNCSRGFCVRSAANRGQVRWDTHVALVCGMVGLWAIETGASISIDIVVKSKAEGQERVSYHSYKIRKSSTHRLSFIRCTSCMALSAKRIWRNYVPMIKCDVIEEQSEIQASIKMITRKALYLQDQCLSCSTSTLQAFMSCTGFLFRAPPRYTARPLPKQQLSLKRTFINNGALRLEASTQASQTKSDEDKEPDRDSLLPNDEEITTASPIPWYLQVQPPQQTHSPLLDRQRLPDLPSDPPPLLQPMLEHISIELGLDDLTLLDLRPLDPPPALGANLLMILGTARSEKHLHVSASRFCRWLRTTHKMKPYADGLLGRGEFKLKMRRKARRSRIMGRVGSTEQANVDDGLRTGWVCVNVGTVEDGSTAPVESSAIEGYVGFGSQRYGAKIVVQMLTEEKREELDLERLWSQALLRQERRKTRILRDAEETEETDGHQVVDTASNPLSSTPALP